MLILTAHNDIFKDVAALCIQSVEKYLERHPKYHFTVEKISNIYPLPPSWAKVELLLKHLPKHDVVLWIDSDCLVVGDRDLRRMVKDVPLNIAADENGLNHGVAAWKNCPESIAALECMWDMRTTYAHHPWWEQAPLMRLQPLLEHYIQPKVEWNAYPGEEDETTQILHFPGMTVEEKLEKMNERLNPVLEEA